jgi:hypothetical protein
MPSRTQRRGSGQSSVPSSPQSSIRRRTSVHTSRAAFASLRRSARLLELLTPNELQPLEADQQSSRNTTNGFLAASLNLTAVPEQSNSSVRDEGVEDRAPAENPATTQRDNQRACSDHEEAAGMSRPPVNDAASRSGSYHILTILVEPPGQTRPGLLLNPPLVMRLERGSDPNGGQPMPVDPALFWAVVSVVPADSDNPLSATQVGILTGTPVDSVHPLNPDATGRDIGYMSFTDLAIREPGRYRLRINLIQMNAVGHSNVPPFEGGLSVQNMLSRVITVDPDVEAVTIGKSDTLTALICTKADENR